MGDDQAQRTDMFLGEFRIVVPGLAALFGVQLSMAFTTAWDDLGMTLRLVNFASIVSTALSLLFILAPSAYHRLTHGPEVSEDFLRYAQRHVGVGYAFLALSLTLSLSLQAARTFGDERAAWAIGGLALTAFLVMWGLLPRARAARKPAGRVT